MTEASKRARGGESTQEIISNREWLFTVQGRRNGNISQYAATRSRVLSQEKEQPLMTALIWMSLNRNVSDERKVWRARLRTHTVETDRKSEILVASECSTWLVSSVQRRENFSDSILVTKSISIRIDRGLWQVSLETGGYNVAKSLYLANQITRHQTNIQSLSCFDKRIYWGIDVKIQLALNESCSDSQWGWNSVLKIWRLEYDVCKLARLEQSSQLELRPLTDIIATSQLIIRLHWASSYASQ